MNTSILALTLWIILPTSALLLIAHYESLPVWEVFDNRDGVPISRSPGLASRPSPVCEPPGASGWTTRRKGRGGKPSPFPAQGASLTSAGLAPCVGLPSN